MSQSNLFTETPYACDMICIVNPSGCPEYKSCKERAFVEGKLKQKLYKQIERARVLGINEPSIEEIKRLFFISWSNGFVCPYCKTKLTLHATKGIDNLKPAASLDHIIPMGAFGNSTNSGSNLQFICHRCNTVKHNLHPDYFSEIVRAIDAKYGNIGLNNCLDTFYSTFMLRTIDKQKIEDLNKKILRLENALADKNTKVVTKNE